MSHHLPAWDCHHSGHTFGPARHMHVLKKSWQWLYIFPDAMREILTGGAHTKAMRGGDMQRGTHATAQLSATKPKPEDVCHITMQSWVFIHAWVGISRPDKRILHCTLLMAGGLDLHYVTCCWLLSGLEVCPGVLHNQLIMLQWPQGEFLDKLAP